MYGQDTYNTDFLEKIEEYPEEYTDMVMQDMYLRMVDDCSCRDEEVPF